MMTMLWSHPSRGEWIEIVRRDLKRAMRDVSPLAG